jgi:hypothetical protein
MIMNTNKKLTIAAAALSGLLAGTASRAMASTSPTGTQSGSKLIASGHKAINLDDTGKNSCKGQNACKGQGGCKTGDQGCKGKNTCKGNGGCATSGTTPPATQPGNLL